MERWLNALREIAVLGAGAAGAAPAILPDQGGQVGAAAWIEARDAGFAAGQGSALVTQPSFVKDSASAHAALDEAGFDYIPAAGLALVLGAYVGTPAPRSTEGDRRRLQV